MSAPDGGRRGWGFLSAMRWLERRAGDRPRVGQSRRISEDVVEMGQDPYLGFAPDDLSEIDVGATPPKIRPRFLGMFGPFGPLPNSLTREAAHWVSKGDRSFVAFVDILVVRFQQLFYRSWSDARAITQFDHPSAGTFPRVLRAFTGDADASYDTRGAVDPVNRLRYTSLLIGRVKNPVRLRRALTEHFAMPVRVEEFVFNWLEFRPEDRSAMGVRGMTLGRDTRLGSRTPTITDKIVIHVECRDLAEYESFLPGRSRQAELTDLVLGYLGHFFTADIALWLPGTAVAGSTLGQSGQLGWTSAMPDGAPDGSLVRATQFQLARNAA